MNIYTLQFDIQWLNPSANLKHIHSVVDSIDTNVDLVVLPEMFLTGFCMQAEKAALTEGSDEIKELIQVAAANDVGLIGSLTLEENGKYYNRVLLIDEKGIIGRYDKQYLFSLSGEDKAFSMKHDTQLIQFKGWKLLPQVCYDLRFPENVRSLPAPDLLLYMANWPTPRVHHWDALLTARAIENQCYLVACNRIGKDENGWEYPGHSKVLRFDGSAVEESGSSYYQLMKADMEAYRAKYQFLADKKY